MAAQTGVLTWIEAAGDWGQAQPNFEIKGRGVGLILSQNYSPQYILTLTPKVDNHRKVWSIEKLHVLQPASLQDSLHVEGITCL